MLMPTSVFITVTYFSKQHVMQKAACLSLAVYALNLSSYTASPNGDVE